MKQKTRSFKEEKKHDFNIQKRKKAEKSKGQTEHSANAKTDSLSAFEEISSAIENKSSARAIEK